MPEGAVKLTQLCEQPDEPHAVGGQGIDGAEGFFVVDAFGQQAVVREFAEAHIENSGGNAVNVAFEFARAANAGVHGHEHGYGPLAAHDVLDAVVRVLMGFLHLVYQVVMVKFGMVTKRCPPDVGKPFRQNGIIGRAVYAVFVPTTTLHTMKKKIQFHHAGCPVCLDALALVESLVDKSRFDLEVVHLGQSKARLGEAEKAGVKSVPALVVDGKAYHINFGASVDVLKK